MLDDDDSAVNRTHEAALLGRQDSGDYVADTFLPNRSHSPTPSSTSSVHRSSSYGDSVASSDAAATTSAPAAAAPRRSGGLSRPHSASALTRPRVLATADAAAAAAADGQQLLSCEAAAAAVDRRAARRLRSCEPALSAATVVVGDSTSSTGGGDRAEAAVPAAAAENSAGEDCGSDETAGGTDGGGGARSRLNQRRAVRAERRYHTADTIHDLDARRGDHDSAIHKRLSLNYGGAANACPSAVGDGTLQLQPQCSSAPSCESLGSFPSSSGVSSTASLCCRSTNEDVGDDASSGGDVDPINSAPPPPPPPPAAKLCSQDATEPSTTDETAAECSEKTATSNPDSLTGAQRLQFLVAERRRLNQELLFLNPALEAS